MEKSSQNEFVSMFVSPPPNRLLRTKYKSSESIQTDVGKEVIHNLKELEKQKKQFEELMEFEERNQRWK